MPNSLKCRLKNLVRNGLLRDRDLKRIIIIPQNATNGDVFMTMFPNLIWHGTKGLIGKTSADMPIGDRWQKNVFYCDTDWWEAPFTREESKDANSD